VGLHSKCLGLQSVIIYFVVLFRISQAVQFQTAFQLIHSIVHAILADTFSFWRDVVKMLRCPFIFSPLYMLKLNRTIADTSRQSYMHMIVCGIRRHQNWGIGPLRWSRERTVETWNNIEEIIEIWKHICHYRNIYPRLVEFELVRTIVAYQCTWRNKLFEERLTLF